MHDARLPRRWFITPMAAVAGRWRITCWGRDARRLIGLVNNGGISRSSVAGTAACGLAGSSGGAMVDGSGRVPPAAMPSRGLRPRRRQTVAGLCRGPPTQEAAGAQRRHADVELNGDRVPSICPAWDSDPAAGIPWDPDVAIWGSGW
jgi:hypothetical protein